MPRYFIDLSYKGTLYAGFQAQKNANTIQDEVEKALFIYFKQLCPLTGSSRTDAGVHAVQNFFHVDINFPIEQLFVLVRLIPSHQSFADLKVFFRFPLC